MNNVDLYFIEGLSSVVNDTSSPNNNNYVGMILTVEDMEGSPFLIDKVALVQARKYGDKTCFNYISTVGRSISKEEYNSLAENKEDFYLEVFINKKEGAK